jgi:hypothetical protein
MSRRGNGPVRTIFIQSPSRHRQAVDRMRREQHRTIQALILEAIELLAMKHEVIGDPSDLWILEFPDPPRPPTNRNQEGGST